MSELRTLRRAHVS